MDYITSHIFFLVCVGLFSVALFSLSLYDRNVVGARWLAAATLLDFLKTTLQSLSGHLPRWWTVCVANELNVLCFVAMFFGLRWFVDRRRFTSWIWLTPVAIIMVLYPAMFYLHMRLWSFAVISLPVLGLSIATIVVMVRQSHERFTIAARITAGLLTVHCLALTFRVALSIEGLSAASTTMPWSDPRWMYSMLAIMLVGYCMLLMYTLFTMLETHSRVARDAGLDALTGALNRRALKLRFEQEMARSQRFGAPMALVYLDLDHFKRVNDTFGHGGGDATLRAFADLARESLRKDDVIARTGGEEFLLLLPNADAAFAAELATRLRQSFEQMRVHYQGRMIVSTVSAGVTDRHRDDTLESMLGRADMLLYRAKEEGRNCVMVDDTAAVPAKPMLVERASDLRQPAGRTA